MPTLVDIESLAKVLAAKRSLIAERVSALDEETTAIRNRKLPGIKSAVAEAKEAESKLEAALLGAAEEFSIQRTIVVHGLRVGFAKGRGKIEWGDESSVVAKIEALFPAKQAELLVKTVKTVRRKALAGLDVAALKRLGCTVRDAGDHVYIAPVDDAVEKLVTRLLKAETPAEAEE